MNKLLLQTLNKDKEVIDSKKYKSLKEIERDLNIDYFALRCIWLVSNGKELKKSLHPYNNAVYEKYRIVNILPEL